MGSTPKTTLISDGQKLFSPSHVKKPNASVLPPLCVIHSMAACEALHIPQILPHPCTLTLLCHINIRSTYFQGRYFYSYGNTKREQQVHRIRFEPYSTLQSSNRRRIWSRNIQSAFISFPTPTHSSTVPVILLLILELHNTSSKAYGSVQYTRTSREYGRHREKAPPCSVLRWGTDSVHKRMVFIRPPNKRG